MKKNLKILIIFSMVLIATLGCSRNMKKADRTEVNNAAGEEKDKEELKDYKVITVENFAEMQRASEELVEEYLEEYYDYKYENGDVIINYDPHDMWKGTWCISPSIIEYEGKPTLVFIDRVGRLMYLNIGEKPVFANKVSETAHTVVLDDEILISNSATSAYKYIKSKGTIELWSKNSHKGTWQVPVNSEYCGFSNNLGYLFRDEGDIYAFVMQSFISPALLYNVVPIANDVKEVLVSNYQYDASNTGVPLFLMNDGTIKAHIINVNDIQCEDLSSQNYLYSPIYEGGYNSPYSK